MSKKKHICSNCKKEITQGHNCIGFRGYSSSNRKVSVPTNAENSIFERVDIQITDKKNQAHVFIPSGSQLNNVKFDDEGYLNNLKKVRKKLDEKIKDFSAGCEINTD